MLKPLIKKILGTSGFELVRIPDIFFIQSNKIDLVLDVGANEGQFAEALRAHGYKGRIVSFEPVQSVFAQLQQKCSKDRAWSAICTAVGAKAGQADINVSSYTVYSSIKSTAAIASTFDPRSTPVRKETVPVETLDSLTKNERASSIFLKIDTQGFEQEVLAGAAKLLQRVVGLQLELSVEHLYEDVWSFKEAIAFLDDICFVPAKFRMVNASPAFPGSGMEFDCVFRRKHKLCTVAESAKD